MLLTSQNIITQSPVSGFVRLDSALVLHHPTAVRLLAVVFQILEVGAKLTHLLIRNRVVTFFPFADTSRMTVKKLRDVRLSFAKAQALFSQPTSFGCQTRLGWRARWLFTHLAPFLQRGADLSSERLPKCRICATMALNIPRGYPSLLLAPSSFQSCSQW